MSCVEALTLPGWVRRHWIVSPTCAGVLFGHQIVRNVGVSKAWIARVAALRRGGRGEQGDGERGAREEAADHATTSIWPIIDMSPCSAAWQWKT